MSVYLTPLGIPNTNDALASSFKKSSMYIMPFLVYTHGHYL